LAEVRGHPPTRPLVPLIYTTPRRIHSPGM
jgi:hypothetical protein